MRFLVGQKLTAEMKRISGLKTAKKFAIAYWGANALKLLALDPKQPDLQILCCLSGGKSAPTVVARFGDRARQLDKLHAKVMWTPEGAIVGSANASSNGLPEEEGSVAGLIEAGVFVDDKYALAGIGHWFDQLYQEAKLISEDDLDAAEQARAIRKSGRGGKIPELADIPVDELKRCKLAVFVWAVEATAEQDREVEKLLASHFRGDRNLDWYLDSRKNASRYPHGYYTLAYQTSPDRQRKARFDGVQYFPLQDDWRRISKKNGGYYVIHAYDMPQSPPGLPRFKFGERSKIKIMTNLRKKRMRLRHNLEGGYEGGFVSWEPLYELFGC